VIPINTDKMFLLKSYYYFAMLTVTLMTLSVGCAISPDKLVDTVYTRENGASQWPDKKLEKQFRTYWSKRFAGPVEDGYNMESPYFRELVPLGKYRNYVQNALKSKLLKMEIQIVEQVSDYMVRIDCTAWIQSGDRKPTEVMMADRWVFVEGKWYHVIRDPLFSL
jgi:hypothetical protein